MTDKKGLPLALQISGVNRHDPKIMAKTIDALPLRKGQGLRRPKNLCIDKGYDYEKQRKEIQDRGIKAHIPKKGQKSKITSKKHKPKKWVVERTHSWHNNYRALLIRWEIKAENHHALLQITSVIIVFNMPIK